MATVDKKYLDLAGLTTYDSKIKAKIAEEDAKKVDKVSGTQAQNLGAYKIQINAQGLVTEAANLSYNDLSDKPTIGDGTLTIQANGTSKGTFTANQTGNSTVNITAEDLGITGVLKFIGAATQTAPTAGQYVRADVTYLEQAYTLYISRTTTGTLEEVAAEVGNVFIITDYAWEVLCTKGGMHGVSEWASLGDESDFARKTTTITGTDGLTGGGDLAENRTISHDTPSGASVQTMAPYAFSTDKFGHVNGTKAITVSTADAHTHTVSGTGTVEITTVTPTNAKLKFTTGTQNVVTGIDELTTSKLVTSSITGVSGSTTASKATAGTAKAYGTADVDTAVVYGKANVGTAVVYGKANVGTPVTIGNANRAITGTVYGKADVGTAVVAGTADVGEAVSIIPAKANGTASKATAGTAITYGTADVGEEVTYGNANRAITGTVYGKANVGTVGAVAVAATESGKQAYDASYDADTLCLNLTPITLQTSSITQATAAPNTQVIYEAVQSSTKIRGAVTAATTQTFTPYTFTDVNVATVDTAVNITPAVTATRTITPATAAPNTQVIYEAVTSSDTITPAVAAPDTQTITPATAAPDSQTITPAKAASGTNTFTPYTFADVTVPVANTAAISVATGELSLTGAGASVAIGLGDVSKADVLKSATLAKAADGTIPYVEGITTGTTQETVTLEGSTGSAGSHTHGLSA